MSSFNQLAKTLISSTLPSPAAKKSSEVADKLDNLRILSNSGFSPQEVFRDLRELYDSCDDEEKGIKFQISKLMVQVHGMLNSEEVARVTPSFQIVINAESGSRVNAMLCPLAPAAPVYE